MNFLIVLAHLRCGEQSSNNGSYILSQEYPKYFDFAQQCHYIISIQENVCQVK